MALQARQLVTFNLAASGIPANLTLPFEAGPASGLVTMNLIAHDYSLANTIIQRADAIYTPSQVAFAAAVPEPQTWALMVMGFGFIGGLVRWRGRSALAA